MGGKILDFTGRNGNFRNDLVTEEVKEDPGAVARPLIPHPAPRDVSSSLAWYAQQTQASKARS